MTVTFRNLWSKTLVGSARLGLSMLVLASIGSQVFAGDGNRDISPIVVKAQLSGTELVAAFLFAMGGIMGVYYFVKMRSSHMDEKEPGGDED